jgi:amino acid transporter
MSVADLADILLGKRLKTTAGRSERIGTVSGVPILGLDALSSAAYGPEAALTILLPLGMLSVHLIAPILAAVILVMTIVCISYRQTIAAYPGGGGSYTVAKENLGQSAGLVAAAALLLDYVLNVAVGISAGVGAIVSALPVLQPHTLVLCLAILALLTLVNLRGIRAAGAVFVWPTYLFIACMAIMLGIGFVKVIASAGHPTASAPPPPLPPATEALSLWLVLRAFASGCTALTGVEAVSNAVPIFREPTRRKAQRTLTTIITLLAVLLAGIALLCRAYGIGATDPDHPGYQSVLSQVLGAVAGRGIFYGVAIASIFSILALSANTSFADFPRVCRLLALDRYLPPEYAMPGRRLVYSFGIVILALFAGVLLIVFGGVTNRLIPLFAIGAFLAFTLSQAGMVQHWRRHPGRFSRHSLIINAVGASATGATLIIILVSKFVAGAWISTLAVVGGIVLFRRIHRYYQNVISETRCGALLPQELTKTTPPVVLVPISRWNRITRRGLRFAVTLSPDVRAVQVLGAGVATEDLSSRWKDLVETPFHAAGIAAPRLDTVPSGYRRLFKPLLAYVARVGEEHPDRDIAVVVPEMVQRRWYHALLRTHHASILKALLLLKGGSRVIIINTPWHLHD